jgi:hypothetical protein
LIIELDLERPETLSELRTSDLFGTKYGPNIAWVISWDIVKKYRAYRLDDAK